MQQCAVRISYRVSDADDGTKVGQRLDLFPKSSLQPPDDSLTSDQIAAPKIRSCRCTVLLLSVFLALL